MSISFEILGSPGRDNALLVRVDSGQSLSRLLFDCGDGCLQSVPYAELLAIDHLFLSHLHMDHIAGFDYLFRALFNRQSKPNHLWGPIGTADIIHHRFRGFLWNLHEEMSGTWYVHEVTPSEVRTSRFELQEAFAMKHDGGIRSHDTQILDLGHCTIETQEMDHGTPSLAYVVREKPRSNVDISLLAKLGLKPGPWLKQLKDELTDCDTIFLSGQTYSLEFLRQSLLTETPGDSIAYLTDFLLDDAALLHLAQVLQGCDTVVCEAQYRISDEWLAIKNHHMTTGRVAELAKRAGLKRLILFHLSDRYTEAEWNEMLAEARAIFPNTEFSDNW
jgi:ribonuclease Z